FRIIDTTIREIGSLAYIKWDANCDIANLGSPYLGADRQANLWFDYACGVYDLFSRLRAAHPEIVFQACSSGGAHCEFGFLAHADEFWGSDDSCSQQRVFIQWGESQFYPASAMGAHVTAVPNHQTGRMATLKFRFDVAMSGRLGFELHPAKMTKEEIEIARRGVEVYKRLRPVVQQGDLYRLVSPYETDRAALLYVSQDKRHAVAFVYGLGRHVCDGRPAPLRLPGLDPQRRYRMAEIDISDPAKASHIDIAGKTISGAALASAGICYELFAGDDSIVIELDARNTRA
ncbi:MAG: alpha-galactosidase, partial [Kiritimatiellae bacterium]|nr:alpha-galactosidase [Kiritimatiellia bacterium]